LLGRIGSAKEIQVWTDVDGISDADPTSSRWRRVRRSRSAEPPSWLISRQGAASGDSGSPIEKNIPVLILNSGVREVPGTRIVPSAVHCGNVVEVDRLQGKITLSMQSRAC